MSVVVTVMLPFCADLAVMQDGFVSGWLNMTGAAFSQDADFKIIGGIRIVVAVVVVGFVGLVVVTVVGAVVGAAGAGGAVVGAVIDEVLVAEVVDAASEESDKSDLSELDGDGVPRGLSLLVLG